MEFSFWKIALVIMFAILLIVKLYPYFAPPKLEHIYLELLSPHHWGSGLILRLDVQKRIKQKLNFNANKFVLSEMKDKKLPKERRVRSKNKKYYSPMCEYKLTEMGELVRNGLLKIN